MPYLPNLNGKYSGLLTLKSGVLQGLLHGALLFLLYINDLSSSINSSYCTPFLFGDDIFLLVKANHDFIDVLQANIETPRLRDSLPDVYICGTRVEFVCQHNCLGVITDDRLNFKVHFGLILRRITGILRRVYASGIIWLRDYIRDNS